MKKLLLLFLIVCGSGEAFAGDCGSTAFGMYVTGGYDTSDADNLKKWYNGSEVYRQDMGLRFLAEGDNVCIGNFNNQGAKCGTNATVVNPAYGDEFGDTFMAAVETTVGGAKFCPTTVIGANQDNCNVVWTNYYVDDSANAGCVWLCRDGYTGSRCESSSVNYTSCDTKLLKKSDYNNSGPITTHKKDKTGEQVSGYDKYKSIAMFKSGWHGVTSGGTMYYQHDIIFVISGWLDNGHGAWLRPYAIRTYADDWTTINSSAIFYPAMKTSGGGEYVSKVLGCKDGYKPDSSTNPTKCVAINATACGESPEPQGGDGGVGDNIDGKSPCSGWTASNFDATKHIYKVVGNCYQWRCKDTNRALPAAGGTDCDWCVNSKRYGINPENGTCLACPEGKIFNADATNTEEANPKYCEDTLKISNEVLLYGKGNSNTSIMDQCWIKTGDAYRKCVTKGI